MKRILAAAALATVTATAGNAALVVDVFGLPTENFFAVEFSGSATNTGGAATLDTDGHQGWYESVFQGTTTIGEFTNASPSIQLAPIMGPGGGAATMQINSIGPSVTRGIDSIVFRNDTGANGDDFLLSIMGAPMEQIGLAMGDMLTFSGTLYFAENITNVYSGVGPASFTMSNFSDAAEFDLTLSFDDGRSGISPVPLPAALPMALFGLGALGFVARRRKS